MRIALERPRRIKNKEAHRTADREIQGEGDQRGGGLDELEKNQTELTDNLFIVKLYGLTVKRKKQSKEPDSKRLGGTREET